MVEGVDSHKQRWDEEVLIWQRLDNFQLPLRCMLLLREDTNYHHIAVFYSQMSWKAMESKVQK